MKSQETTCKEKQISFPTSKSNIPVHQGAAWTMFTKLMARLEERVSLSPWIIKLQPYWPFFLHRKYIKLLPASGRVSTHVYHFV